MEEIASNVDRLLVMNHGQNVAMNGTPAEVFSPRGGAGGDGLAIPKMTQLFLALKRRGVPVDTSVFSVEQARQALRPLLKGGAAYAEGRDAGAVFPQDRPPSTSLIRGRSWSS